MSSEFEKKLSRQTAKQVPSGWRAEILSAAREAQSTCHLLAAPERSKGGSFVIRHSFLSTINYRLSTLLWPHPAAWAGLAAVWIFIFALNFSLREKPASSLARAASPSPDAIVQLHQQHKLYAELTGAADTSPRDADRPRILLPKPRSERTEILAA